MNLADTKLDTIHTSHNRGIQKVLKSYKLTTFVKIGEARDDIMDFAEELKPELLILGTRGKSLIKRMILGSVSDHCIHHSKIPVLIIPHRIESDATKVPHSSESIA
jgi:nucleotide-binding universal stress UspA family protein